MADLANIMKLMDISINNSTFSNQVSGKKRRYWLQSEDSDRDNNKTTTREQRDNDSSTNRTTTRQHQDINEITTREQPDNNRGNNRDNNAITAEAQSDESIKEKTFFLIQNLVGIQKKLFSYIFTLCLERDEVSTGHISTANIASVINCSYGTTKIMLSRLEKKGLVKRLKGKGCRGGFVSFEIPKNIKILALKIKQEFAVELDNNKTTTRQQLDINQDNDRDNIHRSSSSYNYKTTTDDTQNSRQIKTQLPLEWQNIDMEPLSKIGFSITHLSQIVAQNKLTPQAMQDSIYAFGFDLQENNKAKKINGDPINFFMGILRKKGEPYAPPSNYESPQDKAMRIYLERMREIEQGRVAAEKEAINLAYSDWFAQLTDAQKKEFLPTSLRQNARLEKNKILEGSARNHFETEIWPDKKQEIIGKINVIEKEDNEEKIANNNFT